jgi:hypothetical protein
MITEQTIVDLHSLALATLPVASPKPRRGFFKFFRKGR